MSITLISFETAMLFHAVARQHTRHGIEGVMIMLMTLRHTRE